MRRICCCFIHNNLDRYPKLFRRNCLDETVNTATTQITTIAEQTYNDYLKGSYEKFKEKYDGVKDKAKETFTKENAKKIPNKYKEWGETTYEFAKKKFSSSENQGKKDQSGGGIRDTLETVNYYAFQYAKVVKAVLEKIGPLLEGTVKTAAGNESSAGKISIQKIQEIYHSDNLSTIAGSFLGSYQKHQTNMDGITGKDIGDGIKILFSPESGKMKDILNTMQTNLTQLITKEATEFKNPEELVKFIFLGKGAEKNIKSSAETAKSTVSEETTKSLLTALLGEEGTTTLKDLETVLTQLSTPTQPQEQA